MLANHIKTIKRELEEYKDLNNSELLTLCINNKLQKTLEDYHKEIKLNSDYILTRSSFRVLKALTKLQKKADKAVLESIASIDEELKNKANEEENEEDE